MGSVTCSLLGTVYATLIHRLCVWDRTGYLLQLTATFLLEIVSYPLLTICDLSESSYTELTGLIWHVRQAPIHKRYQLEIQKFPETSINMERTLQSPLLRPEYLSLMATPVIRQCNEVMAFSFYDFGWLYSESSRQHSAGYTCIKISMWTHLPDAWKMMTDHI